MAHLSGGVVALLDTLTFPETITILVIALVVLGPEKLPGMAKTIGTWMHKLKTMSAGLQAEVREVMEDPAMQPIRELGEFAAQPKKKLAEYALAAEAEVDRADAVAHAEAAEIEAAAERDGAVSEVHGEVDGQVDPAANATTGDHGPADPEGPDQTEAPGVAEPEAKGTKVVATGPDHPMERLSPSPRTLDQ